MSGFNRGDDRRIGRDFLGELERDLAGGEHVALIGPRGSGKGVLVEEMVARAEAMGRRIVRLSSRVCESLDPPGIALEIKRQTGLEGPGPRDSESLASHLEDLLIRATNRATSGLVVFADNIMKLPTPTVRVLVRACQACATIPETERRLSVMMTGNEDFIHLTYDPNSPYRYAKKYVIRGLDRDALRRYVQGFRTGRGLIGQFDGPAASPDHALDDDALDLLAEETGGYFHLVAEILAIRTRRAAFARPTPGGRWDRDLICGLIGEYELFAMSWDERLRDSLRSLERSPSDFDLLRAVIRDGSAPLPTKDPNDWRSGIAIDASGLLWSEGEVVRAASPLIGRFLGETYRDPRRVADTLALQNRWEEAWITYATPRLKPRDRPASRDSEANLRSVLKAWMEEMGRLATVAESPIYKIIEHFDRGARILLGFDSVSHASDVRAKSTSDRSAVPDGILEKLRSTPERSRPHGAMREERGGSSGHDLMVWSVPRHDLADSATPIVLLTRRGAEMEIDADHRRLVADALDRLWAAYFEADRLEYARKLGHLREAHFRVIDEVNYALMDESINTSKLLGVASQALIDTGFYRRVQFCLVDREGNHIQAVLSRAIQELGEINFPTNEPLTGPELRSEWDIQRLVCHDRKSYRVADAGDPQPDEPRTQFDLCRVARMKGIAVIPMLGPGGRTVEREVLGTLHVEPIGSNAPNDAELKLLESLTAEIASALHICRRLTLLVGSLDILPGRVRILDGSGTVILNNRKEAEARDRPGDRGWTIERRPACPCGDCKPGACLVRRLAEKGAGSRVDLFGGRTAHPFDWTIAAIDDDRRGIDDSRVPADCRVGYVEHRFDLGDLFALNQTFNQWLAETDVDSTAQSIATHFYGLGHQWCRIYQMEKRNDRMLLVNLAEKGLKNPDAFVRGQVAYNDGLLNPWPWPYFEAMPSLAVFRQSEDNTLIGRPPKKVGPASEEFEQFDVHEPEELRRRLEKLNVDRWIAAPLRFGRNPVGWMSLAMIDGLDARRWGLLRWTALAAGIALSNARRNEEEKSLQRDRDLLDISIRAKHQVINALGQPHMFLKDLEQYPDELPERWRNRAGVASRRVRFAMEGLQDFHRYSADRDFPDRTVSDVGSLMEQFRRELVDLYAPSAAIDVEKSAPPVSIHVSPDALIEVVLILAENSLAWKKRDEGELRIRMRSIRVREYDGDPATDGNLVRIEFLDNGPGVTDENGMKQKIFKPYFTGRVNGMGLGLAIAKDFVGRNGGRICEDGPPGCGARFAMTFPIIVNHRES